MPLWSRPWKRPRDNALISKISDISAIPSTGEKYVYALGPKRLTRYYDVLSRWFMPEAELQGALIDRLRTSADWRVLDIGCGSGTLALRLTRQIPGITVIGIDGDPEILAMAEEKRRRLGLPVEFRMAMAQKLPFGDETFDCAVSTLLFHHLGPAGKRSALNEVRRVLKPGGRFFLMDLGPPDSWWAALTSALTGLVEEISENRAGKIPIRMRAAGFEDVREPYSRTIWFGTIRLYEGRKSKEPAAIS